MFPEEAMQCYRYELGFPFSHSFLRHSCLAGRSHRRFMHNRAARTKLRRPVELGKQIACPQRSVTQLGRLDQPSLVSRPRIWREAGQGAKGRPDRMEETNLSSATVRLKTCSETIRSCGGFSSNYRTCKIKIQSALVMA